MRAITITTAALSLITAVFAPGVDADKRECALCLDEAGGLSGCEAEAHGVPTFSCLCNYPGYSTYKLCNSRCEGPDGWPERAPSNVCKNYTTNASSEIFTSTSTTTDDKIVVGRAASATEVSHAHSVPGPWRKKWFYPHSWSGASHKGHPISKGGHLGFCGPDGISCGFAIEKDLPDTGPARLVSPSRGEDRTSQLTTLSQQVSHALPNTARELGSQLLAATTQSHPTIVATVPAQTSNTQAHPDIVATNSDGEAGAQSYASITATVTAGSLNGTIEARSKVTQGPYHFCGVPGGACPNKEGNILPSTYASPTILTKRHEGHNDTAAHWSNTTDTDFNSTSRPGGQPPTGAAAESKGRKLDSNKEKVWLIAVLTAGVVAFAQIKRSL